MLKDVHLLAAALRADSLVASADDKARRAFGLASSVAPSIAAVCRVNPCGVPAESTRWLKAGAKPRKTYRLDSIPSEQAVTFAGTVRA